MKNVEVELLMIMWEMRKLFWNRGRIIYNSRAFPEDCL